MGNRERAIASRLEKWEIEFRAGRKVRAFDAMNLCLTFEKPIPAWAALFFCQGIAAYNHPRTQTLDQAFGIRKKTKLDRDRQGKRLVAHIMMTYSVETKKVGIKKAAAEVSADLQGASMKMSEATAERSYYDSRVREEVGHPQKSK